MCSRRLRSIAWSRSSSDTTRARTLFASARTIPWAQLPPPSVGGLRWTSPVTCGFVTWRPAPSRRPCAVGAGTLSPMGGEASSRGSARPRPAAFEGCSVRAGAHLLGAPRRCAPAGVRPGSLPHGRPRWCRFILVMSLQAFGLRSPRAFRSCLASFISERASNEVPGFGAPALPSASGFEASRLPGRSSGSAATPQPAGGGEPAFRRHGNPAGEPSAETRPSPPVQMTAEGPNRVALDGGVIGEFSERAGQEKLCDFG